MLKLLGAGCLVTAAGLLGERRARETQQALVILDGFLISLTVLESEIAYLASDLRESFAKAAEAAPQVAGFYQGVIKRMDGEQRVADAWRSAVNDWHRTHRLTQRQRTVLLGLAAAWGPWRAEDHVRHIRLARSLLQAEQEAARAKLTDACRMWRYLGVGGGLILALILS